MPTAPKREVAAGDARGHGRAGAQLLGGEAADRSGRRGEQRAPGPLGDAPSSRRLRGPRPEAVSGAASGRALACQSPGGAGARAASGRVRRRGSPRSAWPARRSCRSRRCLRDRAGVAPVAVDRRAGEAGSDAGRVDRRAGDADQQARAGQPLLGRDRVEDLDVEGRDLRALDDRQRGAAHARPHLGQRHDRIGRLRGGRQDEDREQGEERTAGQGGGA